jgi:hypothetical protein
MSYLRDFLEYQRFAGSFWPLRSHIVALLQHNREVRPGKRLDYAKALAKCFTNMIASLP